jgi:hypothetical protein
MYAARNLDQENVLFLLDLAHQYYNTKLIDACHKFLNDNPQSVTNPHYLDFDKEFLADLLNSK